MCKFFLVAFFLAAQAQGSNFVNSGIWEGEGRISFSYIDSPGACHVRFATERNEHIFQYQIEQLCSNDTNFYFFNQLRVKDNTLVDGAGLEVGSLQENSFIITKGVTAWAFPDSCQNTDTIEFKKENDVIQFVRQHEYQCPGENLEFDRTKATLHAETPEENKLVGVWSGNTFVFVEGENQTCETVIGFARNLQNVEIVQVLKCGYMEYLDNYSYRIEGEEVFDMDSKKVGTIHDSSFNVSDGYLNLDININEDMQIFYKANYANDGVLAFHNEGFLPAATEFYHEPDWGLSRTALPIFKSVSRDISGK